MDAFVYCFSSPLLILWFLSKTGWSRQTCVLSTIGYIICLATESAYYQKADVSVSYVTTLLIWLRLSGWKVRYLIFLVITAFQQCKIVAFMVPFVVSQRTLAPRKITKPKMMIIIIFRKYLLMTMTPTSNALLYLQVTLILRYSRNVNRQSTVHRKVKDRKNRMRYSYLVDFLTIRRTNTTAKHFKFSCGRPTLLQ